MNSIKHTAAAFAAMFALSAAVSAEDQKPATTLPPVATNPSVTYATDMKPLFEASCVKCHSGDKPKARLRMDTLEGVLKGTKQGKIVTPGDGTNSLIIKVTAQLTKDPESWMPPPHNKAGIKPLTPEQIGLIRAWIDQGAK